MWNRSMNVGPIIPGLPYEDTRAAAAWLVRAFGFVERLRIGSHRIQMRAGEDGASWSSSDVRSTACAAPWCRRSTSRRSARMRSRPVGRWCTSRRASYGERQCTVRDVGGHEWTFSQTIEDVDPASWGDELV